MLDPIDILEPVRQVEGRHDAAREEVMRDPVGRIEPILRRTYGVDAGLWRRRWRLFFLATAGLFGHADGDVWGVGHYLLAPSE